MKKILLVDLLMQLIIFVMTAITVICCGSGFVIYGYLILGGWQLFSAIGQLLLVNPVKRIQKRILHLLLSILLLLSFSYSGFIVLTLAPLLAIFYFSIGFTEYRSYLFHEMIHLKS